MKNKFFKKALSVFTAMAIALSLMTGIPFSELGLGIIVSAAEIVANGTCGAQGNESSVTWSLDSEGTLTISGTGAMADYEQDEAWPYYYTTPWHDTDNDGEYQNSNIKKVVVEEGITHIGNAAFRDFTELTSISIPDTVKSIGYRSVSFCRKLESLVIPNSVTSIGEEAFDDNRMLTSVTIGNGVESIGAYAFSYAGVWTDTNFTITLPKSVTSIDSKAFSEISKGATIRYSCSYNDGNGYSTKYTNATLVQYHLCEYSSSGNEINCSRCTCGEYSSSTATLSLSSDEPIYYTGEEIKPAVTVTYPDGWGGDKIEPNESNCTYSGNINAGTATCTFKYAEGVEASIDFTIEKADSVITAAPTPADLVYDGTALNLINAGTTTDGEMQYSLEENGTYSITIPTGTDVKTYTVWYKVVGDENHNDTEPEKVEVSIAPKSITVTADNASKTYGEDDPTFTYTATGLEGDTLTGTLSRETGENAETYAITQGTLTNENNPNYDITFVEGTFTINKATPPALTIPTATSITYGDTLSSSVLSDSSWAWVDGTIVPNANAYYNAYIEVDDSNYDYTGVDGYDDVNHRVVRGIDVSIRRATLTITANSYTIKVGSALPTYEYTVTGLVNNDTLPFDVSLSCSAIDSNTVGTYPITISGVTSDALASLYAPRYVNGTLTISEKDIQEIEADDVTLTYGETGKKITATAIGDISYEVATGEDIISVAADGTITALKAGTATVTVKAAETADYAEATTTVSVTVNKKKVAVPTADTAEYTYTGTAQTYGVTSTDDYTVEGGVQTNAGEYPITITLNNENYEWDGTLGTYKFVINKAAVTVTANSYTIKVGEALPTYAYDVAGLVNGETLPIDVTISCTADSNTAGAYDIVVSGAATSDNYTFAFVNGKLTVVETSAGGETGGESGGNEGGVGGSESIPAVTTPSTTPSYTGRPSWVTTPSKTTTTTTTTTTQPPVDEDIDDDTDDEDIEIDEDTDTTKPVDDGDEPQIKGEDDKTGWDVIADEIADADDGDKIVVDMNGTTEVPEDILEQIQGQDIDLVIELDNGFTWTINGESVTEPMDIDLGVNEGATIPVKVINEVTGEYSYITITLTHNGEFGFTAVLTVDMGDENEGLYANLYWYTSGNTEFICADKINNKGKADLTFTHASEYIIVIDETNHGKRVEESDNADEDADSDVDNIFNREEDDDVNPFTAVTISFTGVIISAATIMIARKRKKQ